MLQIIIINEFFCDINVDDDDNYDENSGDNLDYDTDDVDDDDLYGNNNDHDDENDDDDGNAEIFPVFSHDFSAN